MKIEPPWLATHDIPMALNTLSLMRRILYIEDDDDTRELVSLLLKLENYEVEVARNNEDALALARTIRFDLYVMDNWMPGGSGIDLCKSLRKFDSSTPILFYSGAAFDRDKREARECGAQGYLTKPVENHKLIEEVARLISEASTENVTERLASSRQVTP